MDFFDQFMTLMLMLKKMVVMLVGVVSTVGKMEMSEHREPCWCQMFFCQEGVIAITL